jgi:hypothetical protein
MVRVSKRGRGEIFGTRPDRLSGPPNGTSSFLGVKRPERGVNSHAYLALRLTKDYSYTSTPPLPSWQVIGYTLFFRRVLGWVCLWIRMRKEWRTFVETIMNGFCSRSS